MRVVLEDPQRLWNKRGIRNVIIMSDQLEKFWYALSQPSTDDLKKSREEMLISVELRSVPGSQIFNKGRNVSSSVPTPRCQNGNHPLSCRLRRSTTCAKDVCNTSKEDPETARENPEFPSGRSASPHPSSRAASRVRALTPFPPSQAARNSHKHPGARLLIYVGTQGSSQLGE